MNQLHFIFVVRLWEKLSISNIELPATRYLNLTNKKLPKKGSPDSEKRLFLYFFHN